MDLHRDAARQAMNKRGFSLIEVLVALAIFALAAVVLASAYINVLTAYRSVGQRGEREAALQFVRAALFAESDRKKAEEGGDLNLGDNRTARWRTKIESTGVADLFQVTLHCELPPETATGRVETYEQVLMLLRPSWSDPAEQGKLRDAAKARLAKRPP